jgi:hypothetical protein
MPEPESHGQDASLACLAAVIPIDDRDYLFGADQAVNG